MMRYLNHTNATSLPPLLDPTEIFIFNVILPIMSIIGFFINLTVVVIILSDRQMRQLSDSIYIVNLALADLLVLVIGIPFWLYQLNEKIENMLSCQITTGVSFVTSSISILTLAAISYERYCNVTRPFSKRKYKAKTRSLITLIFIWLSAIIVSLPFFIGWKSRNENISNELQAYCVFTRVFREEIFIINFITGCIIMTANSIFYLKLLSVARYHAKRIRQDLRSSLSVAERYSAPMKREKNCKATFTLGVILGVMLICWCPFLCISTVDILSKDANISVFTLKMLGSLTYMNSILDPVVYTFMTRAFKNAFFKIIKRKQNQMKMKNCTNEIRMRTIDSNKL